MNWPTYRDSKAEVSSVSPSTERIKELWVACGLYIEIWSYAIGWCMVTWKTTE